MTAKNVKLAIHNRPGSFSDRWIKYCSKHDIEYRIVNCYDTGIVNQLKDVTGLLWHWAHYEHAAQLAARQIISSVEKMGIKVFPDISTCWHFDDKVGQKYLLESIGAPLVPAHVFFDKDEAMKWIGNAEFPKVFKLRSGAGSYNVRLVQTEGEAKKLCHAAFGKGFVSVSGYFSDTRTKVGKIKNLSDFLAKLKRFPEAIAGVLRSRRLFPKERGYIYFQDFLPDNKFDTRITIIGDRAFGFLRYNRPNDFRASGSGAIVYNMNKVDEMCIKIAFQVAEDINAQSLAFDFIFDENRNPRIVEVSYCYQNKAVRDCPGYWDRKLNWHEGHIWPEDAIIEDLIRKL